MYDELVKRMRKCATEAGACKTCELDSNPSCTDVLMEQAADAIEELKLVANALLAKYEEEATAVIWEYSGNIDESLDRLHKECQVYRAQINGETEPPKEE